MVALAGFKCSHFGVETSTFPLCKSFEHIKLKVEVAINTDCEEIEKDSPHSFLLRLSRFIE